MSTATKDPEEKLVEAGLLFDTYGELLTERQRTFMRLHFDEDLSFSDIAREFRITRQAVHDSVKHALNALRSFENALGLVAGGRSRRGEAELAGLLEGLRRDVEERCRCSGGPLIVDRIEELIKTVRGAE
jgi:predicted DNA-binding protein YlxM (UPF0122 family)